MKITQSDFDKSISNIVNEHLEMDTILVEQEGQIFSHVFPNGTQRKNIRSISKTIVALCVGKAIDEGYFNNGIEELVFEYFKDRDITKENIEFFKNIKIKHLLTLTMGHEERTMNSNQMPLLKGKDLVDFAINYPLKHKPGEYFLYTNPPVYLMSYIMQQATGKKILDYAKEKFFDPMNIKNVTWKESEQGINMGCTGVEIDAYDLLKIGNLLLNHGKYNGKQLINSEWVKQMTSIQVLTPSMYDEKRVLPKYAYGYNLWICKNGNYYCDGTDGQYLIIIPDRKVVIVTMGYQSNMKPITSCLANIINGE